MTSTGVTQQTAAVLSQFAGAYREWAPRASLHDHVRCLWTNDLSVSRTEWLLVVPDGCVDILSTGESLCVAGPDTRPILARLPRGAIIVGVRFHPGAASAWLRRPLQDIVNARVPLAEFWPEDAARFLHRAAQRQSANLRAASLEDLLISKLPAVGSPDPLFAFLRRAAGDSSVPARFRFDHLAAHFGFSERTLRRRCLQAFGYGFKTLDRILRFQRFFRLAARPAKLNLAAMAAHTGYADQAHLTREVLRMTGATAGEFVALLQSRVADSFKTTAPAHK